MRKIIVCALVLSFSSTALFAQDSSKFRVELQGGVWLGSNGTTTLLGLPGPKFTVAFPIRKCKAEFGAMGIPGIFIEKNNNRLGLSLGPTVLISKNGKKGKLLFGAMFFKTNTWHCVPGVGWVF